jgi:hypothetical protein
MNVIITLLLYVYKERTLLLLLPAKLSNLLILPAVVPVKLAKLLFFPESVNLKFAFLFGELGQPLPDQGRDNAQVQIL